MNWNDNSTDDIQSELQRLRPAASAIDPREMFYRAGYEAGKRSQQLASEKGATRWPYLVVAAAITAILSVPISYQFGQRRGSSTITQIQSDSNDEVAIESPVTVAVLQSDEKLRTDTAAKSLVTPRRSRLSDLLFQSLKQPPDAMTLTAFHGASFSDTDALAPWADFANQSQHRDPLGSDQTHNGDSDSEAISTLAVGDTLRSLPRLTN